MDNVFLQTISESYLLDKEIKTITANDIFTDLINFRTNIRNKDSDFNFLEEALEDQDKLTKIDILYQFLDLKYCEEDLTDFLTSSTGLIGAGTILTGLAYAAGLLDKPISTLFAKYIIMLQQLKKRIVKTKLYKMHAELADRYNILEELMDSNYLSCYTMCTPADSDKKASEKDILKSMANLFNSNSIKYRNSTDTMSEDMCTLTCVLDYLSSSIAQLSLIYDRCLSNTGEKNPEINKTVATIVPIGSECHALRDDLNDLIKKFNLIIDRVYHNNPRVRATWIDILDKKISDVKSNKKISNYGPLSIDSHNLHHQMINFNSDKQGSF